MQLGASFRQGAFNLARSRFPLDASPSAALVRCLTPPQEDLHLSASAQVVEWTLQQGQQHKLTAPANP